MVDAPERIWAFLYTGSHTRGEFETTSISWGTEYVRANRIEALERQLAEARAKIDVQRESKEYAQRCCEAAEAERDRLAADLRMISNHVRPLVPKGQNAAQADTALGIIGYMVLLAADNARLREALERLLNPAPGVKKLPPWVYGIAKPALAGKE